MKKLLLFLLVFLSFPAICQESDSWTTYMTPGEMHRMLEKYSGDFKLEISMWDGDKTTVVSVDSHHRMTLGGRFLEMEQQGEMMGFPFEAVLTIGFNTISRDFSLSYLTNMGTGSLFLEGSSWEPASKTAILKGELMNPVSKQMIHVRQVIRFTDANTLLIENYDREGDAREKKTVSYLFTRK